MKNKFQIFFLLLVLAGCCGSRGPRTKAGFVPRMNLVEILFKSMDESVFFAGPLLFKSAVGNDEIKLDFTATVLKQTCDSVKCNFTLFSEKPEVNKESISVKTSDTVLTKTRLELMFANTYKKKFQYRYSFYLSYLEYLKILDSSEPAFIFDSKTFIPPRRWDKNASEMKVKLGWLTSGYM